MKLYINRWSKSQKKAHKGYELWWWDEEEGGRQESQDLKGNEIRLVIIVWSICCINGFFFLNLVYKKDYFEKDRIV